jgi:hypothetical protein
MSKTTKTLLALAVIGLMSGFVFVTGIVNVGGAVAWYMTLPMGAIFLGLFLISKLLEKEFALYDAEQALMLASAQKFNGVNPPAVKACSQKPATPRQEAFASAR